jgi:tripartite ATP-independent transporter DctM subunit
VIFAMDSPLLVLVATFVVFLVLNVPVAFSIGLATVAAVFAVGDLPAFLLVAQRMATGIDSFALLAIPFFILAGLLMGRGGIAKQLMDCAEVFVGPFRGGLAYVNILTCMFFGAISGSATAAVSSIGGFMMPEMSRHGYERNFNASVTITAATTGLLIPPSNIMIVYSLATGGVVSIAAIFIAGVLPGILVGLTLMVVAAAVSARLGYGKGSRVPLREAVIRCARAVPSLLLIVIILGGILSGRFTATEASAVAVLYAFLLSVVVYRQVRLRELPDILLKCGVTTSVVFMLIATSMAMSWVLAHENIPQSISAALLNLTSNKILILLIMNMILLAAGTFMDMTPAVLIFTPIFLPVAKDLGMDPIHFGIVLIMNLCIGLCTPPVGTCLFLGCGIAETTMARVFRPLLPFFASMIAVLLATTYLPWLSLALPHLFGFG